MSNKDQTKDQGQKDAGDRSPQVGALLRASRLRVGEDLRDVSDILCIRYLYLEAIEDCRYGDLPGNTYAVGFIRSYAEHLGLDGDEVVRRYRLEQTGQRSATDLAFPTPVPDSGVPKGAIVFIGVLIALLVYGGWYVTTTDESILSDLISPVPDHLKHLVTGDDAPKDGNAGDTATSGAADPSATGVEQVVRETTEAAEQMANAAGEAAQRTAEAAAEAAATASSAVSETAESVADPAAETTESAAAPATESAPVTTAEPLAATPPAPSANGSGTSATEPASSTSAPASSETATPTETAADTSSAPQSTSQESATAPAAAENSAGATATNTETAAASSDSTDNSTATSAATSDTVTTETLPAATELPTQTETPVTESAQTEPAQAPVESQTETPAPSQTPTTEREVTAEDLNTLVLRQATGGNASTTEAAPAPPETAALNSGDTANTSGIVIRATSSSWVEIRDPATSTIVFTGLMGAGKTFNVPDKDGLILDTGNAGALDITVDGTSVPKIGGVGAVRKNVSLDAERLKAGTAASR